MAERSRKAVTSSGQWTLRNIIRWSREGVKRGRHREEQREREKEELTLRLSQIKAARRRKMEESVEL